MRRTETALCGGRARHPIVRKRLRSMRIKMIRVSSFHLCSNPYAIGRPEFDYQNFLAHLDAAAKGEVQLFYGDNFFVSQVSSNLTDEFLRDSCETEEPGLPVLIDSATGWLAEAPDLENVKSWAPFARTASDSISIPGENSRRNLAANLNYIGRPPAYSVLREQNSANSPEARNGSAANMFSVEHVSGGIECKALHPVAFSFSSTPVWTSPYFYRRWLRRSDASAL